MKNLLFLFSIIAVMLSGCGESELEKKEREMIEQMNEATKKGTDFDP